MTPISAGTANVTFVSNDGSATGVVNVSPESDSNPGFCVQINPNCICSGSINCSDLKESSTCTGWGCTWTPAPASDKNKSVAWKLAHPECSGTPAKQCSEFNNDTQAICESAGCSWACGTCGSYNNQTSCLADATCEWAGNTNQAGGTCSQNSDCQTGLSCISNTCALAPFSSDSFNYHASQLLQIGLASISAAIKNIEREIMKMLGR